MSDDLAERLKHARANAQPAVPLAIMIEREHDKLIAQGYRQDGDVYRKDCWANEARILADQPGMTRLEFWAVLGCQLQRPAPEDEHLFDQVVVSYRHAA